MTRHPYVPELSRQREEIAGLRQEIATLQALLLCAMQMEPVSSQWRALVREALERDRQ